MLHQFAKLSKHPKFEKLSAGRKAALQINVMIALNGVLKHALAGKGGKPENAIMGKTGPDSSGSVGNSVAALPVFAGGRATELAQEIINVSSGLFIFMMHWRLPVMKKGKRTGC